MNQTLCFSTRASIVGHLRLDKISETLYLYLPVTKRAALRWASNLMPFIFLNVDHTEQLYFKEGESRERYEVSLNYIGHVLRFLLKKAKLEQPIDHIYVQKMLTCCQFVCSDIFYLGIISEFLHTYYKMLILEIYVIICYMYMHVSHTTTRYIDF